MCNEINMFRLVRAFEVKVAPEVPYATKVNFLFSLHFIILPRLRGITLFYEEGESNY
jgi:hypothetical protein